MLEVGVGTGTGKNFPYHSPGVEGVGIDIGQCMLQRAQQRAEELGKTLELHWMDAQRLDCPDDSFDAAVATFVFCSVPDAVQGLCELSRIVKPEGRIFLLEHVYIDEPRIIGKVMDLLDPLARRLMGPHINRRTEQNVRRAGLPGSRLELSIRSFRANGYSSECGCAGSTCMKARSTSSNACTASRTVLLILWAA